MSAPQQAMMMAAAAAASGDPYWANVVALLNMGGADGSTTFTDSTGLRTWTAGGGAQIDTSLGYNTAQFDGTGDYVTTPYVQADFDWWTGDYTIEAWVRMTTSWAAWGWLSGTPARIPAFIGNANLTTSTDYWSFGPCNNLSGQCKMKLYYFNGSAQEIVGTATLSASPALTHIAMTKSGSNVYFAVGGTVENAGTIVGTPQSSTGQPLTLGQNNSRSITGNVKALRITRAARYTANFTPPDAPFAT